MLNNNYNIENCFPKSLFSNINLSNIKLVNDFVKNKNLVNILNHKIFKGYNKIKILSNPNFNIDYYMKFFKSHKNYPLFDDFNIYYETKFLGKNLKNTNNNTLIVNIKHLSNKNLRNNMNIINNNENSNLTIKKSNSSNYYKIHNNHIYNLKKINNNVLDNRKIFVNKYNNNRNKSNNLKNINSKIFLNSRENKCFSKYSYVMIDKLNNELNNELNYNLNSINKNKSKQHLNKKT